MSKKKKRFYINPILYLFYWFVKTLVLIVDRLYYAKKYLVHQKPLSDIRRPAIIVANHPSTLMDPLNVAKEVNGIVFFLANAGLFKHWFTNWFFSTCYCIKIERKEDVQGKRMNNDQAFRDCDHFLVNRNGVLYIAPEGTSKVERRIRPLKTGTARIAFSAEKVTNFSLDLEIIPVGLTYSDPLNLRGDVIIEVGQPIKVSDYKTIWEENARKGVKQLTADLQTEMQRLVVHTEPENDEIDTLIQQLENIEKTETDLSFYDLIQQSKTWVQQLIHFRDQQPNQFEQLQQNAQSYISQLKQYNITDQATQQPNTGFDYLKIVLGFPFFIYGYINNFLAFKIPYWVNQKMDLYPGYYPAVKNMVGLITVPFFYWLQCKVLSSWFPAPYWTWIYLFSLMPTGLLAWNYMKLYERMQRRRCFERLSKQEVNTIQAMLKTRREIIEEMKMLLS